MKTMKHTSRTALALLLIQCLLTSCSNSHKVTSSSFIQKRKYTKGYHIDFASKKNDKGIKKELLAEDSVVIVEESLSASIQGTFNDDNAIGAENEIYVAQEEIIPAIIRNRKHTASFNKFQIRKNEIKNDSGSIIVTKKGDTINCKIVRETSERIYYLKKGVSFSSDSATIQIEQSILRKDVVAYKWDITTLIQKTQNLEVEKRKVKIAKGYANASLCCSVLGFLALFLSLYGLSSAMFGFFAFLFFMFPLGAILGIILGIVALVHYKNISIKKKGQALAVIGILLGIVAAILMVFMIIALASFSFSIAF